MSYTITLDWNYLTTVALIAFWILLPTVINMAKIMLVNDRYKETKWQLLNLAMSLPALVFWALIATILLTIGYLSLEGVALPKWMLNRVLPSKVLPTEMPKNW